jgi:DNA modification methylase
MPDAAHATLPDDSHRFGGGTINPTANRLRDADRSFHDWYRFVLSFPPHLVRDYFRDFGIDNKNVVLDPFCGTGTTVVEAKKAGITSYGLEANPMAALASRVKSDWSGNPDSIIDTALQCADRSRREMARARKLRALPEEGAKLLLTNCICPIPLHKSIILREQIASAPSDTRPYLELALAKTLVSSASNLHFGPEVGVRGRKGDVDVVEAWMVNVRAMAIDLISIKHGERAQSTIIEADSRSATQAIPVRSVDFVFTSPPYPNEKDYSRATRLESVLLGFYSDKEGLRSVKKRLVRSNTRGIYKADEDDLLIADVENIHAVAKKIEERRKFLQKDSGFEKLYARATLLYFGGMARHLRELSAVLKPGAKLCYVVGDQASYLQVMIRTGALLAEVAEKLGYRHVRTDLFRTRIATATREQLREEVVILEWPGR